MEGLRGLKATIRVSLWLMWSDCLWLLHRMDWLVWLVIHTTSWHMKLFTDMLAVWLPLLPLGMFLHLAWWCAPAANYVLVCIRHPETPWNHPSPILLSMIHGVRTWWEPEDFTWKSSRKWQVLEVMPSSTNLKQKVNSLDLCSLGQLSGPLNIRLFKTKSMGPCDGCVCTSILRKWPLQLTCWSVDSLGGDMYWLTGLSIILDIPKKGHWPLKSHLFINAGWLDAKNSSQPNFYCAQESNWLVVLCLLQDNILDCISKLSVVYQVIVQNLKASKVSSV